MRDDGPVLRPPELWNPSNSGQLTLGSRLACRAVDELGLDLEAGAATIRFE
jgi:hypothetical protein